MKQVIKLSAKKLVQTYVIFGCTNDNVVSMLARNGYKAPLPTDIVDAIEKLKVLYVKLRETSAHLGRLKTMMHRNKGWLPSHSEWCDDEYQERLEISWEIRDTEDNLNELNTEIDRLKAIAKL